MSSLELRVPPLAVVLAAGLLMGIVDRLLPAARLELPGALAVALALVLAGFLVALAGVVEFRRERTTVNPMKPEGASSLVTGGIYRHTRNPMYLGFALALLGWEVWLQNLASFAVLPLFVLYMNRFQIGPEERILGAIFGEAYATYCSRVRRWL